jgi:hypothetical protein
VFHCALQTFLYDYIGMHKLTLKIEEVIAFTKWLSDKQISAKRAVWNLGYIAIFWTLGTNVSPAPNFMQICTLVEHDIRKKLYFGSGD